MMRKDLSPETDLRLYEKYLLEEYVAETLQLYKHGNVKSPDYKKALKIRAKEHYATITLYIIALLLLLLQGAMLTYLIHQCVIEEAWNTSWKIYVPIAVAKAAGIGLCIASMTSYFQQLIYDTEVYGKVLSDISSTMSISEILNTISEENSRRRKTPSAKKKDWTIIAEWLRNRPSVIILLFWLLTCIWGPYTLFNFTGKLGYTNQITTPSTWEWGLMALMEICSFIAIFPKRSAISYWKKNRSEEVHVVLWDALLFFGSLFFLLPGVLSMLVSPMMCFIIIGLIALTIFFALAAFSWNRLISNNEKDKHNLTELHKLVQDETVDSRVSLIRDKFNSMSSWGQIRFLEWLQTGEDMKSEAIAQVIDSMNDSDWIPKSDRVMVQLMNMITGKDE